MDTIYRHLLSLFLICLLCFLGAGSSDSKDTPETETTLKNTDIQKDTDIQYMVRVAVNDDTKTNSVHNKAEIWLRGHGSWWLKNELEYGGAVKNLGKRPSKKLDTLMVYPDSRNGKEFAVPFMMTDEMNPEGSPRDMITVDISDTEITVFGLSIKETTGKSELKYKR